MRGWPVAILGCMLGCGASDGEPMDAGGGSTGEAASQCEHIDTMITARGIETHLIAFADHAANNGGNRAAGTPGYDASADYVRGVLEQAGYAVAPQAFDFEQFRLLGDPVLEQTGPEPLGYDADSFSVAEFSGPGDVTADVTAVDLELGLDNNATSGCEADDFAGFPAGTIALVQRGECTFATKAQLAEAAGAGAVVLFNKGSTQDNRDAFTGTLGAGSGVSIPVALASYGLGADVAQALDTGPVRLHVSVESEIRTVPTNNIIAQTMSGDPADVLMYGAHLDSVRAGPGINDNGTGSAALLEVARAVAQCDDLRRTVRFAWWGAEESGLLGSTHYVEQLSPPDRGTLRYYLNFDMIGSPNYATMVFDGDGSTFDNAGPGNSGDLEALFVEYFDALGHATTPTNFVMRTDYAAFFRAGIPSGGMFTGAEGHKSPEEQAVFGGRAEQPYDACYHNECDDLANVDLEITERIGQAIAHSVAVFALD